MPEIVSGGGGSWHNMVAETAIASGASHIVSRDEDVTRDSRLAARLAQRGIQVTTVSRFLMLLCA